MKNDIILFLAMLAIAWIGFNLLNERFGKKAAAVEVPAASGAAETNLIADTGAPVVNVSSSAAVNPATETVAPDEQQIKTMLKNRVDAWNDRNLDRYMADYRKFDSLSVTINGDVKKDWKPVYDVFASRFGPEMGTLRISDIEIELVGDYASIVAANWNLQQDSKVTNGRMNLVLNKVDSSWKIINEHLADK